MTITVPQSGAAAPTATGTTATGTTAGAAANGTTPGDDGAWWRTATIYQIYVRSFADGNGDGTGDLAGVRSRLTYLRDLGVDAIWFTPWYLSPLADGGYDVADYRTIDPAFGGLQEAEALIAEARELGIRTIVDVVPNHVSDQHAWFREALAAAPGSAARQRFWFRDGTGPDGDGMPTGWRSSFSGSTWTRTVGDDGRPGQWYLHLFSAEQPDLNWEHPDVRREHEEILRFWFDRGVAGIRIDSAAFLVKDASLPPVPKVFGSGGHPHLDRDELHDIYRGWRRVADEYAEPRVLVAEVWLPDPERFARYLRPDEIHTAFNFDFMAQPWDPDRLRAVIQQTLDSHAPVGAPPTWVLSNHDVTRPVTRYGRVDSSFSFEDKEFGVPTDTATGRRRSRAAAMLTAALPGVLYVYQGDELGLPEVEELPNEVRTDPMHLRSGGTDPGRDGCRVPLPWTAEGSAHGFGADGSSPWLPQPAGWGELSVQRQEQNPASMLSLYRRVIDLRHRETSLQTGDLRWIDTTPEVLGFLRGDDLLCLVNLGDAAIPLPPGEVLLCSDPSGTVHRTRSLPRDTNVWLRNSAQP